MVATINLYQFAAASPAIAWLLNLWRTLLAGDPEPGFYHKPSERFLTEDNTVIFSELLPRQRRSKIGVAFPDRGGHYCWPGWLDRINASGLIRSMSRKRCSSDNAACEGFFGRVKNEMFYGRNWTGITLEKFICFLDRYIRWYNEIRIKLSLGALSPVKYRQHLGLTT